MLDVDNRSDFSFDTTVLEEIAAPLTNKEIELLFVHNDEIQEMNQNFRQKDKATDVLSFPLEDMPYSPLGTIVISVDFAKEKAKELKHSTEDEIKLLFIHGLLHLLGYDHECDEGQMRQKEEELIKQHQLPPSLIVRTEGE